MISGAVDPAPIRYTELPETRAAQTRLLIVDDHAAVRAGLRDLLEEEADFDVAAAVASAEAAMAIAERGRSTWRWSITSSAGAMACG
jgi:PleD family two-component response regulator